MPRPGQVLGLVGTNGTVNSYSRINVEIASGIGKSTALKILAGKQKPNLGRFNVRLKIR
jgi:ATP-binding cassette subfamily E protein 1